MQTEIKQKFIQKFGVTESPEIKEISIPECKRNKKSKNMVEGERERETLLNVTANPKQDFRGDVLITIVY